MPSSQRKRSKEIDSKLSRGNIVSMLLRLSLLSLIFFNLQTCGEKIDFSFDRLKEGRCKKKQYYFVFCLKEAMCIIHCGFGRQRSKQIIVKKNFAAYCVSLY